MLDQLDTPKDVKGAYTLYDEVYEMLPEVYTKSL